MGIASSLQKVANKTLMRFGGDITIKRTIVSSYDPVNGKVVKNQQSVTIKGHLEDVSTVEISDLVSQNDKKVNVAASALTFTPTTKDKVIISSIEYRIIRIDTDVQDNTNIKYLIYLRA